MGASSALRGYAFSSRKGVTRNLALPLLAIGEAVANGLFGHKASPHAKGLLKDLSFGSQLAQKLGQLGSGSDVLSQLGSMLQAGTPLATIIDRVAKLLSEALAGATGNAGNTDRRRTLQRALAAALAPPGTSPPHQSGLQQAASLESRLGDLLSKVTRELKNAGQQNRFPGAVLDAKSAREIPAQQQTKDASGLQEPAGQLAIAESILRSVLQQLQGAAPQSGSQTASQSTLQAASAPQQLARQVTPLSTSPIAPQITTQSADVLGRMLARAASADAQRTAPLPAAAAPVRTAHAAVPSPSPGDSPQQLFVRLMNVIVQASSENTARDGGKQSQEFAFAKSALPAAHDAQSSASTTTTPAFSTALTTASAPATQSSLPAAAPHAVDPQSVIEQVVQGIVLRNFGTTSEVRMRLQPEHLGDVSLKLTVTGNTISANIVAQNADVRDMLLSNQQMLARTLADAGLSLGNFSVDVSGGNPGFSQQRSAQQRSLSKAGGLHANDGAEDETWAEPRFGPPVLAGSKSIVLNYLA